MLSIQKNLKVHFIGIGGIGMSGIANILVSLGFNVSGSDLSDSLIIEELKSRGAQIFIGHHEDNVVGATLVVFSSAVTTSNSELSYAKKKHIPIMRRAEMLAELMKLKKGVAIAGTHGKTTTTSMLATILEESRYEPTYVIGGVVSNLNGHSKVGKGEWLIAEADESDGSFLLYSPIMSLITNIDADHLDYYGDEDRYIKAFKSFANKVPFYGECILNANDEQVIKIIKKIKKPYKLFGTAGKSKIKPDYVADNIKITRLGNIFDLFYNDVFISEIKIGIPGEHNVLNALGAIALAHQMGVSFEKIASSITRFSGVGRRFNTIYKKGKFEIIDDYAHHPTEIFETLTTLRTFHTGKLVAIFEPHRFSRTRDFWNEFIDSFKLCDHLYLCPIYPASENPIDGVTSERLSQEINLKNKGSCHVIESTESVIEQFNQYKNDDNTIVIVLGAGKISKHSREAAEKL